MLSVSVYVQYTIQMFIHCVGDCTVLEGYCTQSAGAVLLAAGG